MPCSTARLAMLHGSSTTWFQTLRYCCAKGEFNLINWVRHGSSTMCETGLIYHQCCILKPSKKLLLSDIFRHLPQVLEVFGNLQISVTLRAEPVFVFVLIQEVKIRWMNMKLINNLVFLDFFWNEFLVFLS